MGGISLGQYVRLRFLELWLEEAKYEGTLVNYLA